MDQDPKSLEKLKELESSIARELDQKVTLSEPTDPRLDGSVHMNPTLVLDPQTAAAPVAPAGAEKAAPANPAGVIGVVQEKPINSDRKVEDISLDEVDELLNEADETFASKLGEIKSEVSKIQVPQMESLSIGADYLKEGDAKPDIETEAEASPENDSDLNAANLSTDLQIDLEGLDMDSLGGTFWVHLKGLLKGLFTLPFEMGWGVIKQLKSFKTLPPKMWLIDVLSMVKVMVVDRLQLAKLFWEDLTGYSPKQYIQVLILVFIFSTVFVMSKSIIKNSGPTEEKDPFLQTFDEVANTKKEIADEEAEGQPEFMISIPRLVANLKVTQPGRHPMGALEIYMEASDRDAAMEIKNREKEVRDILARTLEQMSFEDLDTPQGKEKLKLRFKVSVNAILNNGRVQGILFKSIQIHQ